MKNLLLLCALFGFLSHCTSKKDTEKLTFEPFSNSTLRFQIKNEAQDTLLIKISDHSLIPDNLNIADTVINSSGSYYLTLTTDRSHQAVLSTNDSLFDIVPNYVLLDTGNRL